MNSPKEHIGMRIHEKNTNKQMGNHVRPNGILNFAIMHGTNNYCNLFLLDESLALTLRVYI